MKYHNYNPLHRTQKRLLAVVLLVTFLFCLLAGRLFYLQIVTGQTLQTKALDQWTRDLPLKARRGDIVDRNGVVIASSYTTYAVYVRPRAVTDKVAVAKLLSDLLHLDYSAVLSKIAKNVSEVTIAKNVEKAVTDQIKASGYGGIYFGETSTRTYPYGDYLSRVVGFTDIDAHGATGLESYYDKFLTGTDGKALTQTDIGGIEIGKPQLYIPSIPGMTLTLTVDSEIQKFAEWAADSAGAQYSAKSASCIVMDARDGGILAMATSPGFDLNEPPKDNIDTLNALSKNLLITDVYEPGSTFKIFTTAAALEEKLTRENDRFYDPGYRLVDGQRIRCWKTAGHGSQTLAEGVQNSCNSVFMDLALRLGTKKMYSYLHQFGFGAKTNIDFMGESAGIMMNEKNVKTVDLARMGFGQAVAVTPVQVMAGVSAVVNGGYAVKPHFARSAASYDQSSTLDFAPSKGERIISESTSRLMSNMLEKVVSAGGGKQAQVEGYQIGGKTGTAQKYENGAIAQGKYVSSFVGFGPVEDPRYVVMMIVDEPQGYIYYGSLVAAPYAGKVFSAIFDYADIAPSVAVNPDTSLETVCMPNLIGLTLTDACARLAGLGLQYEVAGVSGSVSAQVPAAGTMLKPKTVTLIRLTDSPV